MRNRIWTALLLLTALPLVSLPGRAQTNPAALQQSLEQGRRTYQIHCASCHGSTGQGDGPVAKDLKIAPTDLTRLTARNNGQFPRDQTYMTIDGRQEVRGHGTSTMPVWGLSFQVQGSDKNQETEVRERIQDLLAYLRSIQK